MTKRIRNNGWNAAILRLARDANPYEKDSRDYKTWDGGWISGTNLQENSVEQRIEHAN